MKKSFQNSSELRREVLDYLDQWQIELDRHGFPASAARLHDLWQELKANLYTVAFVGTTNAGKSTLMNAMLGEQIFPMKSHAFTPAVTRCLRDRDTRIEWKADNKTTIQTLQRASIYHTLLSLYQKLNNDFNRYGLSFDKADDQVREEAPIIEVDVYCDLNTMREDIVMMDTPGINDLSLARAEVVRQIIHRADAVVVILDITQGIKSAEGEFIREKLWKKGIKNIFFVANKYDALPRNRKQRQEALDHMRQEVLRIIPDLPSLNIYPLSGYLGLWAKLLVNGYTAQDEDEREEIEDLLQNKTAEELLHDSQIDPFQRDLWQYLDQNDRMSQQLRGLMERVQSELALIRAEVDQADGMLKGEGSSDIAQQVRNMKVLGERATAAKMRVQTISRGKDELEKNITRMRTYQTPSFLRYGVAQDREFESMEDELINAKNQMSFSTPQEFIGDEKTPSPFMLLLDRLWGGYWAKRYDEMTEAIQSIETSAREEAESFLFATLEGVKSDLGGHTIPVLANLQTSAQQIRKPWIGKAAGTVTGLAATVATGFGGIIAGPAALAAGVQIDRIAFMRNTSDWIRNMLRESVENHRREMQKVYDKACEDLRQMLEAEIDSRFTEIKDELTRIEQEAQNAEQVIASKKQWLTDFAPILQRIEDQFAALV